MSLKYPDEVDFTDVEVTPETIDTADDVVDLACRLEETVKSQPGDEYDLLLAKMGMKGASDVTFLWDGNAYGVLDSRQLSHHLVLSDYQYPESHQHAQYKVEDLDQFICDWFNGDVTPATQTGEWVPTRETNVKTYALAGENTQDPHTQYTLLGDPVEVNTEGLTNAEIFDRVCDHVSENPATVSTPLHEDPDLFLIEITDFKAVQP